MIKILAEEVTKINHDFIEKSNQFIIKHEIDLYNNFLILNFNYKLDLKITYNGDKRFIKFEILKQDERFWSTKDTHKFIYKSDNNIIICSSYYIDYDFQKENSKTTFSLLGEQSLINDGVTIYLSSDKEDDNYYIERLRELFIALLDWSYNASEFNVKEEVKPSEIKLLNNDQKTAKVFRLIVDNDKLNEDFQINGFNFIENFNAESSMIMLEIKKEDVIQ